MKLRVSYNWSGQCGLLPEVIGAAQFTLNNPALSGCIKPTQPANTPAFPNANPSRLQIKVATDANNLRKRDWAVVCGFCRGAGENRRDALDLEFYPGLEHKIYEYVRVLPRKYIKHLETKHCPLDVQAIQDLKDHYARE